MEDNTDKIKKKTKKNWWLLILVVGIILVVIFIVWLLMKGDVKTTGNYPEDESPQSLECVKKDIAYSFFTKDNPSSVEIKINAIFTNSKLNSISLTHRTAYSSPEAAKAMSDDHEGDMNISFQNKGKYPYSLGATYSQDGNIAQMALYAKPNELNDEMARYFMLSKLPENLTGYKREYLAQGFNCEIKR